MAKRVWDPILVGDVAQPLGAFSHGATVMMSPRTTYVHTSGITSRDEDGSVVGPGDIEAQTRQVLKKLTTVLADAGCELGDVLKITVFITDMSHFEAIHKVRREFFDPPYPASTMVEVSRLVDPSSMIEIEAIACRQES